jgi:hypothetical protein
MSKILNNKIISKKMCKQWKKTFFDKQSVLTLNRCLWKRFTKYKETHCFNEMHAIYNCYTFRVIAKILALWANFSSIVIQYIVFVNFVLLRVNILIIKSLIVSKDNKFLFKTVLHLKFGHIFVWTQCQKS